MLSFFLTNVVCAIVGLAFPGYMSFKALETFDPEDEKQWLTYWIIFALMQTIETFGYWFLLWIPLYYELKLCAIIWLIAPQTRGAQVVYKEAVYPLLHKYASQFDPTFSSDGKLPPEMQGQLFKQAQAYLGKQGNSVDDLKTQGFDVSGVFGKLMGK